MSLLRLPFNWVTGCFILLSSCSIHPSHSLNLSFEQQDSSHRPRDWRFSRKDKYETIADSSVSFRGKYSIRITNIDSNGKFGAFNRAIPVPTRGDSITLSGYIKTENVNSGYAGLWMRISDHNKKYLGFDNMKGRGATGTKDWEEFSITLPLEPFETDTIYIGGLLVGNGRAWIDAVRVTVDGRPLELLAYKKPPSDPASFDSLANYASGVLMREYTPAETRRLAGLGMLWGFLKYYHPAVGKGIYDWDSAFLRLLPPVLNASDDKTACLIEEAWVRRLGKITPCASCRPADVHQLQLAPDYGYLFDEKTMPASFRQLLSSIRDNYRYDPAHYYVQFKTGVGNPFFRHEQRYSYHGYPPAALRLLSLYRYWSMIQYYYPYRYLIQEGWNEQLAAFIPRFIKAEDEGVYLLTCLEMIGHIHDTHANIYNHLTELDSLKGFKRIPFEARFAEGKLVVTGYVVDSPDIRRIIPVGTVVTAIDGVPVDSLIRKFLPLTPASNYPTQLRELAGFYGWLQRSARPSSDFEIQYQDTIKTVHLDRVGLYLHEHMVPRAASVIGDKGFALLDSAIGYIKPSKLHPGDLLLIRRLFAHTRGVIFDLRCYPSLFMPFSYGAWLKRDSSAFAYFSTTDLSRPGGFLHGYRVVNGAGLYAYPPEASATDTAIYTGKVIIIVDATTQSNAEYTAMALATSPSALVIGSTTAGADGNVTNITLPGDVSTLMSGIGVYYPDGGETQRVGIRIDRPLQVTVKGVREGRDEFLEEAIRLIRQ